MAISTAAKQIIVDNMNVVAAGGQDSISMVQTPEMRVASDSSLIAMHKDVYMPMLQTAEEVAKRYGSARDAMDEYAFQPQMSTAPAHEAARVDADIRPGTPPSVSEHDETRTDETRRVIGGGGPANQ